MVKNKTLVGVLVVAVLMVAGALLWSHFGGGAKVPLAAALEAETTVGAAGLDPVAAWRSAKETLDRLPSLKLENVDVAVFNAASVQQKLGFDPGTREGWESVGVDVRPGLALALDARGLDLKGGGGPVPVLLLKLTDRAKALAALERITGQKATIGEEAGPSAVLTLGEGKLLIGEKAGLTAIGLVERPDALPTARAGFDLFLKGGGTPLPRDPAWKTAFGGAGDSISSWTWIGSRGAGQVAKGFGLPSSIDVAIDHYVQLFPAFATWNWIATEGRAGGMVVASPEAVRALEQIFKPRKGPPKLTGLLPSKGAFAFRWSVNLHDVTGGIVALMPPNAPAQVRMGLELGKAFLPTQIGASWGDITDALSGHFAVAADASRLTTGDLASLERAWVALAGVQAPDKADALLSKLAAAADDKLGLKSAAVDLVGARGYHVGPAEAGFTVVRKDDILIAGPHEMVDSLVRGQGGLKDPAAACFDEDVAFASYWDTAAAMELLKQAGKASGVDVSAFVQGQTGGLATEARLKSDGVHFAGQGGGTAAAAIAGVVAALAVPAFEQYQDKTQATEADLNLRLMAERAWDFYRREHADQAGTVMPLQFPGTGVTAIGPDDWHEKVCPSGGAPTTYLPDSDSFAHPVFQALGFRLNEPFRFQYQFVAEGTGNEARFTARAVGDLDCDGLYSTYERTGSLGPGGEVKQGGPFVLNPGE